jgi:hypothetical protein
MYRDGNVVICGKVGGAGERVFCPATFLHVIATICLLALLLAQTRVGDDRRIWITDGNPQGTATISKIELVNPFRICATDICTGAHVVLVDDLVRSCLPHLNAILAF